MTSRRAFLGGLLVSGLLPSASWADAGSPAFLSAAKATDGTHHLFGLDADGTGLFRIPLPQRGHAAAAHPSYPQAVAFARRPGTFALVLDCVSGRATARLTAPPGRHFYGHGAFSADGARLFTTENDYEAARGMVGVWDTSNYRRIGEFPSHGTGPHDIALLPDTQSLVVANGGIETHPDTGRAKLNLPAMRPNLSYLSLDGALLDQVELDATLRLNSIRHLAVRGDGLAAFAMQWQGDGAQHPPLLGLHKRSGGVTLLAAPGETQRALKGYAGSVALSQDGKLAAISSPRGGMVHVFDTRTGDLAGTLSEPDICGLSSAPTGFLATSGQGRIIRFGETTREPAVTHSVAWDNHLIAL